MMIRPGLLAGFVFFALSAASADDDTGICSNGSITVSASFDGGDVDACHLCSKHRVELEFRPEDDQVEDAFAWFAFRISSDRPRQVEIRLRFPVAYARFWPKLSDDGVNWSPADESTVDRSSSGKAMTLTLDVDASGTWVAAQELLTSAWYEQWLEELAAHEDLETAVIGKSVEGRPIMLLRAGDGPEAVVLLGRQHPAEVPAAIAMREFVDVVLGSSELARRFRERYMLLIVPLINPDGVANGHSRHNAGKTDLNRDWGPFTQPETRSVATLLDELDRDGARPRLMLDFHATKMTPTMIFYTQAPGDDTNPPGFATRWLGSVDRRIDDYEFEHDPRPPSGLDNTKNYFFSRYGIPAITYEIGDEADRGPIGEYTPVFAEEMMKVMLEAAAP